MRTSAASSRRAERGDGLAGEVDERGIAQHVAEHRPGALVIGVELVERLLESLPRISTGGH
jgi:hypothetical protein